ncbi:hypothetical protein Ocin01_12971 [Orchesella cincta]|uniref:Chitin-binding type-2 domain-containing protein n=1 Tax=Orchesella cincta TaxID=48709 RepID=A0A1D2ML18_ORCCI|nr:hypothetical protein Ocin01_12971 [Orchesella cincta]
MSKGIVFGVCVSSFLFVYICSISAISLHAIPDYESVANKSISCTYVNPIEGPIPNPYNCSQFYVCRPADDTSYTIPDKMECAIGLNEQPTFFDFRTCKCEHDSLGCYNPRDHGNAEFFNCATLYNPNSTK